MVERIRFLGLAGLVAAVLSGATTGTGAEIYAQGIIYPIEDVRLSLPVDGAVAEVAINEGDVVTRGQKLLQLDDRLQMLEVERRKLDWEDSSQRDTVATNVAVMREMIAKKEHLYATTKTLSLSELQRGQMQLNNMEGELKSLTARQSKARIEYEVARQILDSYTLASPIAGVVVEIVPAVGEWVKIGEAVIRIVNNHRCYLDVNVDIATARRLAVNKKEGVRIQVASGDQATVRIGRVDFIAPVADSGSSLVRMKISFDNEDGSVISGVPGELLLEPVRGD